MPQDDLFVTKHLARNVHEDFDGVCERIRLREFSHKNPQHRQGKRYKRMIDTLGGDSLPQAKADQISEELNEIAIRFLAIQITIDKRVSVRNTFDQLRRIENSLRRAANTLDDPDIASGAAEIRTDGTETPTYSDVASIMSETSLLEKVSATQLYIAGLAEDVGRLKDFFDYKYGLAKAGQPSLYARVFAVHALAELFERENSFGLKATVGQVFRGNDGAIGAKNYNSFNYTGRFLAFVEQFYFIFVPDEVVGRVNEGFADQVRRLATRRTKDPDAFQLMMGSVTVEGTLEFMKRADAVK